MKKIIFILIVFAAITTGCINKEDASLRIALKKVYGTYDLVTYTVNGLDSLDLYKDSLSALCSFFYNDVHDNNLMDCNGDRNDGMGTVFTWDWRLINENKILQVTAAGNSIGTGPFGNDKLPEWEIIRLTNKEMNLKTIFNGKEYYVEYVEKQ